jgi:hypothetical protein
MNKVHSLNQRFGVKHQEASLLLFRVRAAAEFTDYSSPKDQLQIAHSTML